MTLMELGTHDHPVDGVDAHQFVGGDLEPFAGWQQAVPCDDNGLHVVFKTLMPGGEEMVGIAAAALRDHLAGDPSDLDGGIRKAYASVPGDSLPFLEFIRLADEEVAMDDRPEPEVSVPEPRLPETVFPDNTFNASADGEDEQETEDTAVTQLLHTTWIPFAERRRTPPKAVVLPALPAISWQFTQMRRHNLGLDHGSLEVAVGKTTEQVIKLGQRAARWAIDRWSALTTASDRPTSIDLLASLAPAQYVPKHAAERRSLYDRALYNRVRLKNYFEDEDAGAKRRWKAAGVLGVAAAAAVATLGIIDSVGAGAMPHVSALATPDHVPRPKAQAESDTGLRLASLMHHLGHQAVQAAQKRNEQRAHSGGQPSVIVRTGQNPWTLAVNWLHHRGNAQPGNAQIAKEDHKILVLNKLTTKTAKLVQAGRRLWMPKH